MKSASSKGGVLWPIVGAVVCLALGSVSGLLTGGGGDPWYRELVKPPGTPPGWVFGPVWSLLYVMMGVAAGRLVYRRAWHAVAVFGMQFVLNLLWTPMFFGMHQIAAALAVIGAIWLGIVATLSLARKTDPASGLLLLPYLAWTSYATYLNAGFLWLNR